MKFFALLLVVALSGCFFPGGHCGLHPSSGEWDAPALYEELIANPIPNAQRLPPEPGWMLPTASWATNITSVARDGQHAHFGLDALGRVTGHLRSDTGAARDDARAFLAGLTGANDTILDAWVDELLTTAHKESDGVVHCDGYECVDVDRPSSVAWQLPVAADVVGRWNALDEVDALMIFPNHARGGHWEFALSIEQVYVVFDAWQLNIDASGHAMSAGPSMGEVPESQYISHIERDLQAAGLPTDGVSRMHVGGAIC